MRQLFQRINSFIIKNLNNYSIAYVVPTFVYCYPNNYAIPSWVLKLKKTYFRESKECLACWVNGFADCNTQEEKVRDTPSAIAARGAASRQIA